MGNPIIVLSTCGDEAEALKLARAVVEARLAACVNIMPPVRSIYRWEGKIESAEEFLLLVKTTDDRFAALREMITALHSYDTPEIIALPIVDGSEKYLAWLSASV
jgi:periplasmic divalent cation tolerance protein